MSGVLHTAAERLNSSTGGVTPPSQVTSNFSLPQPPVDAPASPAEVLLNVPTEFGDLTGLFGGVSPAEGAGQYAPVNTALDSASGVLRGALGGLKPDFAKLQGVGSWGGMTGHPVPGQWDPTTQVFQPEPGGVPAGGGLFQDYPVFGGLGGRTEGGPGMAFRPVSTTLRGWGAAIRQKLKI